MARRRSEDTSIDQYLRRRLADVGVPLENIRRNATTRRTSPRRGDLWISRYRHDDARFEDAIITLIECKDHACNLGDADWETAKLDGRAKAQAQGLKTFFVTNTRNVTRCYSVFDLSEVQIDGRVVADLLPPPVLSAIQAQVRATSSAVRINSFATVVPDANRFRTALSNLRNVYRSKGLSKGQEEQIIKTTLTFCILKLLSEKQNLTPILPTTVSLWGEWRLNQMDRDVRNTIEDIIAVPAFAHLHGALEVDAHLDSSAVERVVAELSPFNLFGSDFDFFGLIYETYASKTIKKDFGEFYTPRHIVRFVVRHLFGHESDPRPIRVCDPACGTGGFLVETFLFLQEAYRRGGHLSAQVQRRLRESTFVGLDTNVEHAIPYARTNMIMAGDGGAHIRGTEDSLREVLESEFDYVIANVPYGQYAGDADISTFSYTNKRRFELLFLEKIVEMLKPGGKAAVIVPDGLVQNTSGREFRRKFLFDVRLDRVVSLPGFAFLPYTHEKTYILFFEKKKEAERGQLQRLPIWHYIADNDGYQAGNKRFPISEDDLTSLSADDFGHLREPGQARLVEIAELNDYNFFRLDSEYHLRRQAPIEMSEEVFEEALANGERLIGFANV